jgi:hypothetical protein
MWCGHMFVFHLFLSPSDADISKYAIGLVMRLD